MLVVQKHKVLLLFVASNVLRYARIKSGEPGNEATPTQTCDPKEAWLRTGID